MLWNYFTAYTPYYGMLWRLFYSLHTILRNALKTVLQDGSDEILCNLNSVLCCRTCMMKSWSTSRSWTKSETRVTPSFSDPVTLVSLTTWCNSTPSTRVSAPHPRWEHSSPKAVLGVCVLRGKSSIILTALILFHSRATWNLKGNVIARSSGWIIVFDHLSNSSRACSD